jgi:pimeloyl-ACP methyl ester carboxylesterase
MVQPYRKWVMSAAGLIAFVLLLGATGAGYQILLERRDASRFPAPGQFVDVGGRRLHVICSGSGAPSVLIEASGLGTVLQSAAVQRELATTQRVCSYDRAGLGWSDASPNPATASALELDLEQLLKKIDLPPPLILVASSAGGLDIELFTRKHPELVLGLVWVDALSGSVLDRLPEIHHLERSACLARAAAWLGIIRFIDPLGLMNATDDQSARTVALTYRKKTLDAACSLTKSFDTSAKEVHQAPMMRSMIAAVVLVHGEPRDIDPGASPTTLAALEPKWRAAQATFAQQFIRSSFRVLEKSGHLIVSERPDVVIKAVRDVQCLPQHASSN